MWKREMHEPTSLKLAVRPFETPHAGRSLWQLTSTIIPFLVLWWSAHVLLSVSFWLTLPVLVIAAGFLVRIFVIFHDCCHGSFWRQRRWNQVVGVVTGILTWFPYAQWRREHAIHHASNGNLSRRGTGDIWTLTVREYCAASRWRRLLYRLYRHPLVMFGLGPVLVVVIQYRWNQKGARASERWNTYATNAALAVISAALCWLCGWQHFLLIEGTILYLAGMAGIWLFYVQHQFDPSYFASETEWDHVRAALEGSSFYRLPRVLQWFTANIGYHHVHHLSSRIPNYYLERAWVNTPALAAVPGMSLRESLRCLRHRLWDEENRCFVGFRDARLRATRAGLL